MYPAWRGEIKFKIAGDEFKRLGEQAHSENPVYLIRTLPEKLYRVDGTKAYGTWTGGLLGVVAKQMEDFNQFHHDWYIDNASGRATHL